MRNAYGFHEAIPSEGIYLQVFKVTGVYGLSLHV